MTSLNKIVLSGLALLAPGICFGSCEDGVGRFCLSVISSITCTDVAPTPMREIQLEANGEIPAGPLSGGQRGDDDIPFHVENKNGIMLNTVGKPTDELKFGDFVLNNDPLKENGAISLIDKSSSTGPIVLKLKPIPGPYWGPYEGAVSGQIGTAEGNYDISAKLNCILN